MVLFKPLSFKISQCQKTKASVISCAKFIHLIYTASEFSNHYLMSAKPMAVTIRVEGTPNLRCFQKDKLYPKIGARRACSHTIKLAADPNRERFPATVLTQANISHAFFSSAGDIAAADAATRAPSNRTETFASIQLYK